MQACDEAGLAEADELRRVAMLAADTSCLARLLSEALVYVHSSGARDDRASYLDKLERGLLCYEALTFTALSLRILGKVGLIDAEMRATVLRNGTRHTVTSHTLSVWQHIGDSWQLEVLHAAPAP